LFDVEKLVFDNSILEQLTVCERMHLDRIWLERHTDELYTYRVV